MCSYITQNTFAYDVQSATSCRPPRPEGLRQGIRDPDAFRPRQTLLPRFTVQDAPAALAIDGPEAPYASPRRPRRPDTDTYAPRGTALKWPDRDPDRRHLFSRPSVPTALIWSEMSGPPSAYTTRVPSPRQTNGQVLAWAMALRHGGSPLTIREDDLPGEVLVANWPIWRHRKPMAISAIDALRGAEEIRLRILRNRVIAVIRRGPLSFFVTVAVGEAPGHPAHLTPAGKILPASLKLEVRRLLRDAGLLTGTERRFDAALGRYRDIEQRLRHHLDAAYDAATRRTWADVYAELIAANDVAAPLRHPAAAVRLGPALDPDLYGEGPRPKTRRRDAEHAAKAVLGRLAHAVRKLHRHTPQETETLPLAAE